MSVALCLFPPLSPFSPLLSISPIPSLSYNNSSFLHVKWATSEKLLEGDKRFEGKVKRYKAKQESVGMFMNVCSQHCAHCMSGSCA